MRASYDPDPAGRVFRMNIRIVSDIRQTGAKAGVEVFIFEILIKKLYSYLFFWRRGSRDRRFDTRFVTIVFWDGFCRLNRRMGRFLPRIFSEYFAFVFHRFSF